jgi:hypothetical protein
MNIKKFKNFESNSFDYVKTNVEEPGKNGYGSIKIGGIYPSSQGDIEVKNIYIDAWSEVPRVLVEFRLLTGNKLEATETYVEFIERLRGKKIAATKSFWK